MKKNEFTRAHIILFAVSLLAVLATTTSYVRGALRERQMEAQSASRQGAMGRGIGGAGGGGNFNPQQMAARRLEQMTQQLQLTAEQRAKIQAIQEANAPRTRAIFEDATLSRQQRREKLRPLRAETDAQIRQLLTPEQQTKFDEMQAQRRARFGAMGGNRLNRGNSGNGGDTPGVNPPPAPQSN